MANDPRFPAVEYLNILEGFQSPQRIPTGPHNLPPRGARPLRVYGPNGMELMGAQPASSVVQGTPPSAGLGVGEVMQINDPHHYAHVISAILNPVSTDAQNNAVFLNAPSGRRNMLSLRNQSATANLYVDFGKAANTLSPLKLTPGQTILFDVVVPQDDLYAFADAAAGILSYAYSTIAGN